MTLLPETVRRPPRSLWTGVVLVIAALLLAFGGAFAFGGIDAAPFPVVWEAIVRYVPGGMRTYGGVLLTLGVALLHGVLPRVGHRRGDLRGDDIFTHYALSIVWGVSLAVAASILLSWALTHVLAWGLVLLFTAVAALAWLCWRIPPDDATDRTGRVA